MDYSYWHKQTPDDPLFKDLLWSRPENRQYAGKMLIVGGNSHGFSAPAEAYAQALQAGIGYAKALLPDTLRKMVSGFFEEVEFTASTPSGSIGTQALGDIMSWATWAQATLLAGDFGRNSETAILLEKFLTKYPGAVTLTKDAVDYFCTTRPLLLERPQTTVVLTIPQLQRLAITAKYPRAITYGMGLLRLIDVLHELTSLYPLHIITKQLDTMIVASAGNVSTTKLSDDVDRWRIATAAAATTWWIQNPEKPFAALTTSMVK